MTYTTDDILQHVGPRALDAGKTYQSQRRVLSFEKRTAGAFHSKVQGNERRAYEQEIIIERSPDSRRVVITSDCTCPVGGNCKHVAAALLEGSTRASVAYPRSGRDRLKGAAPPASSREAPAAPVLPPDIAAWLGELERARATASEDYPKGTTQRIVYVLAPQERACRTARLALKIMTTRLLKDGDFSEMAHSFNPDSAFSSNPPKYLRPSDLRICRKVSSLRREYGHWSDTPLSGDSGREILEEILGTGRARWLDVRGPALALGPAREGLIDWELLSDAKMAPRLDVHGEELVTLNAVPPLYVEAAAGMIGTVETGLAPKIAAALLDAPNVPIEHAAALGAAIEARVPEAITARPAPPAPPVVIDAPPVIVLRLLRADLPAEDSDARAYRGYYGYENRNEPVGLARLLFRYGAVDVEHGDAKGTITRLHDGGLVEIRRNQKAEKHAVALLQSHGFIPAKQMRRLVPYSFAHDFLPEGDELAWFDALYHDLPRLKENGWIIEIMADFPVRLLHGDGDVDASLRESSGIDWLELDLGVTVDGERIDLVGPIVALIGVPDFDLVAFEQRADDDDPYYLRLPDGRFLALPIQRLAPIVAAIYELACGGAMADKVGRLRLSIADAAGIADFEAATMSAGLVWRGGERLREMGRKLTASGGIPTASLPETFMGALRPYQAQGVSWLAFLRDVGLGGVLGDDMGLGKTVQALALVAMEKAAGRLTTPALVIAPTSLMANWRREAEKFAPDLRVLILQGHDRKERFDAIDASDVVLTTYPLIARDHEAISARTWHLLFLDEAQTVKNPHAVTTKLIRSLEARHRFCLTGTPLENHLGELWSLFSVVSPGLLGDLPSFTQSFRTPIEKKGDSERGRLLAKRIKPFLLRRTKDEVARDLPPKTEIVERVEMEPAQRDIYESIRLSMHERVRAAIGSKGFARSRIIILDALLKLRQACCDPRLL